MAATHRDPLALLRALDERVKPAGRRKKSRSQEILDQQVCAEVARAEKSRLTVFEPYRAPGAGA